MIKEIEDWLADAGHDYEEGVSLMERYLYPRVNAERLAVVYRHAGARYRMGDLEAKLAWVSRMQLEMRRDGLPKDDSLGTGGLPKDDSLGTGGLPKDDSLGTGELPKDESLGTGAKADSEAKEKKTEVTEVTVVTDNSMVIDIAKKVKLDLWQRSDKLHQELYDLGEKNEKKTCEKRAEMLALLQTMQSHYALLYEAIEDYFRYNKVSEVIPQIIRLYTTIPEEEKPVTLEELEKRMRAVNEGIRRNKKHYEESPKDSPKQQKYLALWEKFAEEKKLLEKKLKSLKQ